MTKTLTIAQQAPGVYDISGHLTFAAINKKTPTVLTDDQTSITLNFNQIESSDSAGLALIIEWLKSAQANQVKLQLNNLPKQIISLAKLSSIDLILNSETAPIDPNQSD